MKSQIRIFASPAELSAALADDIVQRITSVSAAGRNYSIALSGGSSPALLYSMLGDEYAEAVPWEFVHVFWGDERCVPPFSTESNYFMTRQLFTGKVRIPEENIHRIKGEEEPEREAARYASEMSSSLPSRNGIPVFDLLILGIGEDGHTASVFPGSTGLFSDDNLCAVTAHPVTKQQRITISLKIINNSEAVVFLVTGSAKAELMRNILRNMPEARELPASKVIPVYGSLDWYLDKEAASLL